MLSRVNDLKVVPAFNMKAKVRVLRGHLNKLGIFSNLQAQINWITRIQYGQKKLRVQLDVLESFQIQFLKAERLNFRTWFPCLMKVLKYLWIHGIFSWSAYRIERKFSYCCYYSVKLNYTSVVRNCGCKIFFKASR